MCSFLGLPENYIEADILVKDGDIIEFGGLKATIIHTPGHTAGSMSILIKDAIFGRQAYGSKRRYRRNIRLYA